MGVTCKSCGRPGIWAGDPGCPNAGKASSPQQPPKGKSKTKSGKDGKTKSNGGKGPTSHLAQAGPPDPIP